MSKKHLKEVFAEIRADLVKPEENFSYNTELSDTMDMWKHKSTGMRCHTCMYFVVKDGNLGRCRRHAPQVANGWPAVYTQDWCGDHKLDKDNS